MESTIEKYLKDQVEVRLGGWCVKLIPWFESGLPDRLLFLPGARIELVETKDRGKKLRPTQRRVRRKLKTLGFTVLIIDTKEKVDALVDHILRRTATEALLQAYRNRP